MPAVETVENASRLPQFPPPYYYETGVPLKPAAKVPFLLAITKLLAPPGQRAARDVQVPGHLRERVTLVRHHLHCFKLELATEMPS